MAENYKGVIIEESLENGGVLQEARILETRVEEATEEHKTPWVEQWTLHTVEIPEDKIDQVAENFKIAGPRAGVVRGFQKRANPLYCISR